MPIGDITPQRAALRSDRSLMHEEGACLPLRSRHGQCRACAQACPVQALEVSLHALTLGDTCTACGLCTAACPTEALFLPELAVLSNAPNTKNPSVAPVRGRGEAPALRIECRKVPVQRRQTGSLEVPCLGAVRASHLLARVASGIRIQVVDRGWCEGCETGSGTCGANHPAAVALEVASMWLEAAGSDLVPTMVLEPLPLAERPHALPSAQAAPPQLDRRRFFREALERPAGRGTAAPATPMGGDGKAAYPADRRQASPDRQRLLAAVTALSETAGQAVPAELFPQMQVNADCCDQRLCVALCPTSALSVSDNGLGAHLQFSSERCISCSTCVRACPEGAIQMEPVGGRLGVQTVFSHTRRACATCGDTYTPSRAQLDAAAPSLCPACSKSRHFMDDARRQLFGQLN